MCAQAKRIITFNPQDAKELLDRTVKRARSLVFRFEGLCRTELEDAMFHRDLDLTAIQMKILQELMGGSKQAKGRASAGLVEVHYERGEGRLWST